MGERFVLATHNPGKRKEMSAILGKFGIEVVMPADLGIMVDVEETGETFAENAMCSPRRPGSSTLWSVCGRTERPWI